MRISIMRATCCAAFCQVDSSPERKRHWVGRTWPVSMYASGLCVAAAPSGRWEDNTLSLSPAVWWRNLSHISSLNYSFLLTKKKKKKRPSVTLCGICFLEMKGTRSVLWKGRQSIFTTTLRLSRAETSSRRSKKITYKGICLLTKIQQKIYTPEE